MRIYYTDHFELPLPEGHRFPMSKYRLLRQRIATSELHSGDVLVVPPAATDEQLLLCHTPRYLDAVKHGTLTAAEIRRIGFPWSLAMVERSRRSTGATIAASRTALVEGISANLAGGTHHAFADAGEGYCVFNDAAVAIRTLQHEGTIERACVIDLDVHQGNGTASILSGDNNSITFSMHGAKNFPSRKVPSDIDIPLADGIDDGDYLDALARGLEQLQTFGPFNLAIYLAGADPFRGDRLGRMNLTKQGLAERDSRVISWATTAQANGARVPLAIAMAGGYASNVNDIADIHAATISQASRAWRELLAAQRTP